MLNQSRAGLGPYATGEYLVEARRGAIEIEDMLTMVANASPDHFSRLSWCQREKK